MAAITPVNGREDFITAQGPHTYWELNSTNLGTNYGDDTSGNDDNSNVTSGDISTQDDYEGMNNQNDPPASGWMDIYIITDAAMLVYIPAGLTHGTEYGLFHNGGGVNAQAMGLCPTETGVEVAITHNANGSDQDALIEEIPDADSPSVAENVDVSVNDTVTISEDVTVEIGQPSVNINMGAGDEAQGVKIF